MSHFILTLLLFLTESCYIFTHLLHKNLPIKNVFKKTEKTDFSSSSFSTGRPTGDCVRGKTVTVLLHRSTKTFLFSSSLLPNQHIFGCRSKTVHFLYMTLIICMTCKHIINHVGLFISVITEGSTRCSSQRCKIHENMHMKLKVNV